MPIKPTYRELEKRIKELEQAQLRNEWSEDVLKDSERIHKILFNCIPVGIGVSNLGGSALIVNDAMRQMFGFKKTELNEIIIPNLYEDPNDRELCLDKLKKEGVVRGFETIFIRNDGTNFYGSITVTPIKFEQMDCLLAVVIDITKRKLAEYALKESESRFSDIAENALEWIWEVDQTGKYTYSSPTVKKILGYEPKEVLGKYFHEFFHPDEKRELMKKAFNLFNIQKPFRKFLNWNSAKNGDKVVLLTSGIPKLDAQGNLTGYRGTDTDITDFYMTEKILKETEKNVKSLMINAKYFTIYRLATSDTNPHNLKVVFVSPSIIDIMGVTDPNVFETWFENIHEDDRERIIKASLEAFETGKFNEIIKIYHPLKKEIRWIHSISNGIKNKKGETTVVNGIIIDITQQKLVENALVEKEKELRKKSIKLEDINFTLNILLDKREKDKIVLQEQVLSNVNKLIIPYIKKLRESNHNETKKTFINLIESNLNQIVSPFSYKLSLKYYNLSPTELQIADLIRNGKTTREISKIRNVSYKTVEVHRVNIRKKIGIKNKKVNLQTYLSILMETEKINPLINI